MSIQEIKIARYQVNDDFFIDIEEINGMVEFWLFNKGYGVKMYMFSLFVEDVDDKAQTIIDNNVDMYIKHYLEEYGE
jgi:hypothetical protein